MLDRPGWRAPRQAWFLSKNFERARARAHPMQVELIMQIS
jgi:hypothetical protein